MRIGSLAFRPGDSSFPNSRCPSGDAPHHEHPRFSSRQFQSKILLPSWRSLGNAREWRYTRFIQRYARMIYFKSVLVGISTVLLGCVVTPIVGMVWYFWKATVAANKAGPGPAGSGETLTVSFSPLGFIKHPWFWLFIIALFSVGFLVSLYLQRR